MKEKKTSKITRALLTSVLLFVTFIILLVICSKLLSSRQVSPEDDVAKKTSNPVRPSSINESKDEKITDITKGNYLSKEEEQANMLEYPDNEYPDGYNPYQDYKFSNIEVTNLDVLNDLKLSLSRQRNLILEMSDYLSSIEAQGQYVTIIEDSITETSENIQFTSVLEGTTFKIYTTIDKDTMKASFFSEY